MPTFLRLLKLIAPFKWWIALAALLGFATVGSSIGLMATSAYIISKAALQPSIAVLQVAVVGVRFFGISRGLFRYLERLVSHQITFRLLARLRVWFYQRLEPLAPARLMQYRSGDLLARIVSDIETLENFYVRVLAPPLVAGLTLVLMGGGLASFDDGLAATALFFLLLAGIGIPLLARRLSRKVGPQLVAARAELNAAQIDGIQGVAELLTSDGTGPYQKRLQSLSRQLAALQQRQAGITGLHSALTGLLANWATLAALLIAIPLVSRGELNGVFLAVIVLAVIAAFEAVLPLPETAQQLDANLAAARRLFDIVDTEPSISETTGESPAPQDYSLRVRDLSFRYAANDPFALQNISFYLPPGHRLAIVGPSGAGKSSLVNVLLRFWEYEEGDINLGGHDLRAYRFEDARRIISVVSQRTHLFNDTIKNNLRLARPNASDDAIVQAARQAQMHTFVQSLPQGYDTWIGEQGLRLSGGERQRLAIARALLQNAPILILDEPTANLDSLVEREIMRTLHILMAGRTTLLITHRLVGLETADEILVLQDGRIMERGREAELLAANGLYRQMRQLQRNELDL